LLLLALYFITHKLFKMETEKSAGKAVQKIYKR
jgi:hypothetical protein